MQSTASAPTAPARVQPMFATLMAQRAPAPQATLEARGRPSLLSSVARSFSESRFLSSRRGSGRPVLVSRRQGRPALQTRRTTPAPAAIQCWPRSRRALPHAWTWPRWMRILPGTQLCKALHGEEVPAALRTCRLAPTTCTLAFQQNRRTASYPPSITVWQPTWTWRLPRSPNRGMLTSHPPNTGLGMTMATTST